MALDRAKLISHLHTLGDQLFPEITEQFNLAQSIFKKIVEDIPFQEKAKKTDAPWPVPNWSDLLDQRYSIAPHAENYICTGVDGSQIYPDRHQGFSCSLVNVGSITISYQKGSSQVSYAGDPYVFTQHQLTNELDMNVDTINSLRQELELQYGYEQSCKVCLQDNVEHLLLFDGSLIFWNLDSKKIGLKEYFFPRYITLLDKLYNDNYLYASYISGPRSREITNLIRLYLCDFDTSRVDLLKKVEQVCDMHIMRILLQPGERSIVFENRSSISEEYPSHLKPHFFYIHIGPEIGRVEFPAYVAQDIKQVDRLAQIILDQCTKGGSYPVVLAEAHESAVVKGPDRDFFYHMLQKMSYERNRMISMSSKLQKKRGMAI